MKQKYDVTENIAIKVCLREARLNDCRNLHIQSGSGLSKNPKKYGNPMNRIYPLLDPEIESHEERIEKHATWFKQDGMKTKLLLEQDKDDFKKK